MGEEQKELRREETKEAKIHMGQTSERVEKAFKGVSLFLGVLELGLACMYILFSVAWVLSGYENFLLNRKWIVLPGCFLGVTALQLLLGVTLFHGWDGWRKRFFGGAGWAVGLFLALLSEGLCFLVEDGGFLEKALTGALLFLLVYMSAYPLSLFERYGWKGALRVPFMVGWEVVLLGIEGWLFWGEENTPLTALTFLFLLLAGICAGFLRFLGKGWGKGEEPGRKKLLFARVAATALGGLLLINFFLFDTDEFFSPSLCQDEEGYFLICSREGFVWFIDRVESGYENSDARLTADIVLNDTGGWERWEEEPPENQYDCMINYSGHFDGNGYALEGYYSKKEMPVFCILEEGSSVTNLKIRKSLFQTTYEKSAYLDEDGEVMVVPASALCFADYGRIEGCEVEARVLGAWEAGGIAAVHYGEMRDCCFGGIVEGGRDYQGERGEERWARETLYVGGLCRAAQGIIENCQNEGMVSLDIISDTGYMNYASGGIVGNLYTEGKVENCINRGKVEGPQLCGGIAGASRGEIRLCANAGNVHVEQADMEYTQSLITAGICASNGGLVDSCRNTGEVTVSQRALSFYAPVYGIACNLINPQEGETGNCYYLPHRASQDYRQAGVYKLSEEEMAVVEQEMASGEDIWGEGGNGFSLSDTDTWELLSARSDYAGTDPQDYIHLRMGPKEDTEYTVLPGDTLWDIAGKFYGDGSDYPNLERVEEQDGTALDSSLIYPGETLLVPRLDYYLLHANGEEGFGWSFCQTASGEMCPTRFFAAKPADWYYGSMDFAGEMGLAALWPKDRELRQDAAASDIRILYYIDGNPEGDFLAGDWEGAKEKIRESARRYCGEDLEELRFYRYELDGGESLYGYSFLLNPTDTAAFREEPLECAVFYRLREGLLAEFIGIEPVSENMQVLERTRYLAARIVEGPAMEKLDYTGEEFYAREGWPFTRLHNPFATALEYSPQAECSPFMLFTGAQ